MSYDATRVTLADYLQNWLASIQNSIRTATYDHYKILINTHISPALGSILLSRLTSDRIQAVYDGWIRSGIGAPTVIKAHAVLHQALVRAVRTGILVQNPAQYVTRPTRSHVEMRYWSEAEANRFLTTARDNRLYALFHLAITTGARQMELLGLQWGDLDWNLGTLHICRQLARRGELFADLKTKAGKRTIKLGGDTLVALRSHYELQLLERRKAGDAWQEHDLLFTTRTGSPIKHKNLLDRYFQPLVFKAGIPQIRFHDLRHTAVSLMLSNGVPIFVVSKIIGHSRPSITSDTYGHLVAGADDQVGQMMDELVSPITIKVDCG